ncbi:MAG: hypothetical protein VX768_17060 [Planctomycetota bacterium]|nr:hypothetical protein [Planctomycetota bacterium]
MNEEHAKQLCLKVVYGGALSIEEKPVWDAFMETDSGKQYLSQSSEMRLALNGIAKVDLIPEPPQDLADSFVEAYRRMSEKSQSAARLMTLISAAAFLLALAEGWQAGFVREVAMLLIAGTCGCISALIAIFHNHRVRKENDLIGFLKKGHTKANRIFGLLVGAILVFLPPLAIGAYDFLQQDFASGLRKSIWCLAFMLVVMGIHPFLSRLQLRKEDPDAFDWWQNELKRNDS